MARLNLQSLKISSHWGAVAGFIAMQCYGIFLFHNFVGFLQFLTIQSISDFLDGFLLFVVSIVFLAMFLFLQAELLPVIRMYLRKTNAIGVWMSELRLPMNMVRAAAIPVLLVLYFLLFFRPQWFGLPQSSQAIAGLYQIIHPLLCWVGGRDLPDVPEFQHQSLLQNILNFFLLIGAGIAFCFFGYAFGSLISPWGVMGISILTWAGIGLLIEEINWKGQRSSADRS